MTRESYYKQQATNWAELSDSNHNNAIRARQQGNESLAEDMQNAAMRCKNMSLELEGKAKVENFRGKLLSQEN